LLILNQNRFSEFIHSIEGINTKTLSIRLKEIEEDHLVKRIVVSRRPVHTEYAVTDNGLMVEPILEALTDISLKYEPKVIFKD
jgi:DNA-binding HxlR family transcriptional regulator